MSRGRPRKLRADIPPHIDQSRIPAGVYFERGVWVMRKPWRQVGDASASLADLYQAVESDRRATASTELRVLCNRFMDSPAARKLAASTRTDYAYCINVLAATETRIGGTFLDLDARKLTQKNMQRLVDYLGAEHPAKANHVARFLSRLYKWAKLRVPGIDENPATGLELADEKGEHRMPELTVMRDFINHLLHAGALPARSRGSCPNYLAPIALLAYRCRMRGIEVLDLTDDAITGQGILVQRRKGSRPNFTRMSPDMRRAIAMLRARRERIWHRRKRPMPMLAKDRYLVVDAMGDRLSRRALTQSWARAMKTAIARGIIAPEDQFGLHGIKHRGVTDTSTEHPRSKQPESGHQTQRMTDHYDHEVPIVNPAGTGDLL